METIYIKLQNEGVDVWRPVQASFNSIENTYYIELPPINVVPQDEEWEFVPGMSVSVKQKEFEGKSVKVAISQIKHQL